MRYAIIANPVSGKMNIDQKRSTLAKAARILDAEIHGMDTATADELCQCAQELVARCDILVVAGGDGTLSDIINSIDTARIPVAYLPLGTGNAMRYALRYKGDLVNIAMRIKDGKIHAYDLIDCDGKARAFTASIGIDGEVVRLRDQYILRSGGGFNSYFKAVVNSYLKEYKRATAMIAIDDRFFQMRNLLSLMVVKQPYYGFGMKVVPRAQFGDRQLHMVCVNAGLCKFIIGGLSAFTIGNRIGQYYPGLQVNVSLDRPLLMQFNGNEGWRAEAFAFTVLPKALKIKC